MLTIPLKRGGAAMEIEVVDPQTGRRLAASTPGWRARVTELMVRFSKLAAAEIARRHAAALTLRCCCKQRRMPGRGPHCVDPIPNPHFPIKFGLPGRPLPTTRKPMHAPVVIDESAIAVHQPDIAAL